jgi:hypothetical protein
MSHFVRTCLLPPVATALAVLTATVVVSPHATAAPPNRVSYPVDVSYPLNDLTNVCGFDVWAHLEGTFKGVFRSTRSGVASEFDSQPATRYTTYSPTTGKSFSVMFSTVFHVTYPDGIVEGGRVVADITGFNDKVPGIHAAAGRAHFEDGVILVVQDGVPLVDYGEPSVVHGRPYGESDYDQLDALTCAQLAS